MDRPAQTGKVQVAPETESILIDDIEVAYRRSGSGEPVVFVHGLAEDGTSWSEIVDRLPPGSLAYVPDLRGHGGTTAGNGKGTAGQLAGDLIGFLERLSGPAVCVGFSLGGVVVLQAALDRPDLVRKAVVVGTSSKVGRVAATFFEDRIRQLEADPESFRQALATDTDAQVVRNRDRLAEVARTRVAAVGDGRGYANAARAMIALAAAPMTERLREIRVPVHIIQGAMDTFCPRKAADMLRDAMPKATYAEIPEAGHLIAVDQPDLLAREIAAVLKD